MIKWFVYFSVIGLVLIGCSYHVYDEPYPEILEAEQQQVDKCTPLGVISETASAANPWALAAKYNAIFRVRNRAGKLGATHIVWLHRTENMATAQTYRCP